MFFFTRFIICLSSCRPFCFQSCNVPRHIHISRSLPVGAGPIPIISSAYLIHVNVTLIHSPRCACVCLCFILSTHSPSLIVILPSSLLHHSYTLYSSSLVSIIVVFHTTHARLSNPALLIFASLHTPPALPLTLDRQRSRPPLGSLLHSL